MFRRALLIAIVLPVVSLPVLAHVTVWPRESRLGSYEKYVVRVPTEGKVATTSVELQVPDGVAVVSIGAPNGYTYELKRAGDRIVSVVWSMQIQPGEFAEFAFMARNPKEGTAIVWKAVQTAVDGTQTKWVGAAKDKHPASITTLAPAEISGHSH